MKPKSPLIKLLRWSIFAMMAVVMLQVTLLRADEPSAPAKASQPAEVKFNLREMFEAGGVIGIIILGLSMAMVALICEHLLSFRRGSLMPAGLAEEVHGLIARQQFAQAEQVCKQRPSFLGHVLGAGLSEIPVGYAAVEKAMEDSSREQSARLFRKIEYLSVIGTIAPMLGLLGTVWGMILAFMQFSAKANPQVAELAPGIYKALVTTFLGLSVAVPALASFALFRNRIDELVAEASLLAEHVFLDYKKTAAQRKRSKQAGAESPAPQGGPPRPPAPSVTLERGRPG